jgi:hypothetical protein
MSEEELSLRKKYRRKKWFRKKSILKNKLVKPSNYVEVEL